METWKDVPGYGGLYSVSDLGRVRRHASRVWVRRTDHASHWKRYPERILRPLKAGAGYLAIQLFKDDVVDRVYVHRLVYAVFVKPIPHGLEIDHMDRVRTNNALANLRVTDRRGNMSNPLTVSTRPRGDSHYASRVSDADAIAAYSAVISGERVHVVAKRLGVCRQTVGDIIGGRTRKHLRLPRVVLDTHGRRRML